MSSSITIGVLVVAGVMLVIQNLLMVRMTASVSTVLITLVINSGVGLMLLLSGLIVRNGFDDLCVALRSFEIWYLLPGLFGSFFVFASILGYQRVGSAITISTLVASQIITGLVADGLKSGSPLSRFDPASCFGAVLLVAGAFIITRGRG